MNLSPSRDEKMYKQTDFLDNVKMDNTKDERDLQQQKKNEERLARIKAHTLNRISKTSPGFSS